MNLFDAMEIAYKNGYKEGKVCDKKETFKVNGLKCDIREAYLKGAHDRQEDFKRS